jgi:hypothetical protein
VRISVRKGESLYDIYEVKSKNRKY